LREFWVLITFVRNLFDLTHTHMRARASPTKRTRWNSGISRGTYIYKLYRVDDSTVTCGTPACISRGVDISRSAENHLLLERNGLISFIMLAENCNWDNLYKPRCHVVSKAFPLSKNTAVIDTLLLKFKVTWSESHTLK
jgi:hypothetical protein